MELTFDYIKIRIFKMYSKFGLDAELDKNRKITDLNSVYRIKLVKPVDLVSSFYEYGCNFYKAAHTIASYLLETENTNIAQLDTYFFSLAFLYRHSIELILKALAFRNIPENDKRATFAKDTFHDLEKILDKLLKLEPNMRKQQEIDWLKNYFADISKMDKESDSFRYPFHIHRTPADLFCGAKYSLERVFEEQTHIDLCKFANKFEATYEILNLWYLKDEKSANEWKELKPVFIETGGSYYGQAVVGYGYTRWDFYPYINAYTETAGYLRMCMTKFYDDSDISAATDLFIPMCYLYRNAVELLLKASWFEEVREDFQNRCKILNKKKHKVVGLWNKLRCWMKEYFGEETEETNYFDEIEVCCNTLHNFDTDASIFRYPCKKDMQVYFMKDVTLDFLNVAEFMESLINSIDNIYYELSYRNDYINEAEAEMRAEMEGEYRNE